MNLRIEKNHEICTITLNRPEVYNCINMAMTMELKKVIEGLYYDREVRVLLLTGEGDKAFCTGADLKERRNMSVQQVEEFLDMLKETFLKLEQLSKPVIAAVNGMAFGGGTELALACDLRIAASTAQFGLTETSLGIIPGGGGTQRLPRLIGKSKAKELIYTARHINATEAYRLGLVNHVTEPERLIEVAWTLAEEISANAPLAIAQAKYAIDVGNEADLITGLSIERQAYETLIPTQDRIEGLQAFQEKRKPMYKGE